MHRQSLERMSDVEDTGEAESPRRSPTSKLSVGSLHDVAFSQHSANSSSTSPPGSRENHLDRGR